MLIVVDQITPQPPHKKKIRPADEAAPCSVVAFTSPFLTWYGRLQSCTGNRKNRSLAGLEIYTDIVTETGRGRLILIKSVVQNVCVWPRSGLCQSLASRLGAAGRPLPIC